MKLYFIGANHEVTGSAHFVEACGKRILIDCGMEQGKNKYENAQLPCSYRDLDYILVTHAHIDHTGMLPYACKQGFSGTIVCSQATAQLANIMLRDCAHIQLMETEYKNRKARRAGLPLQEPLYDMEDVEKALACISSLHYMEELQLCEGIQLRLIDAGHLLGSASIELYLEEEGCRRKLVFSGDIGNTDKPLIRDPHYIESADFVLMESTYGNRLHERGRDHVAELADIIQRTLDRGGNVVLPAFAVGRTQELLYLIREIKARGLVRGHENFPVYVDSPLAVEATEVFSERLAECYDAETEALVRKGINPIGFPNLRLSVSTQESQAINADETPKVIISASGMCDAGRIRHHIKHNVWRPESSIVFAGYQAVGTLGRQLSDGAETIRLFGEELAVRAAIEILPAMSSHADQEGLLRWASAFTQPPVQLFLIHGEDDAMSAFASLLRERLKFKVACPYSGSVYDLRTASWIVEADPRPVRDTGDLAGDGEAGAASDSHGGVSSARPKGANQHRGLSAAYTALLGAYQKLLLAVEANREGANADLEKFRKQIEKLYEKWIR